jgi:hypothetical protein
MTESEAIALARKYLSKSGREAIRLNFARFVPANSPDPLDVKRPDDTWHFFFDIDISKIFPGAEIEPNFFVLEVNCRTKKVSYSPVM